MFFTSAEEDKKTVKKIARIPPDVAQRLKQQAEYEHTSENSLFIRALRKLLGMDPNGNGNGDSERHKK